MRGLWAKQSKNVLFFITEEFLKVQNDFEIFKGITTYVLLCSYKNTQYLLYLLCNGSLISTKVLDFIF